MYEILIVLLTGTLADVLTNVVPTYIVYTSSHQSLARANKKYSLYNL